MIHHQVQKWISNTIEYLETSIKRDTELLKVNEKQQCQQSANKPRKSFQSEQLKQLD